MKERMKLLGLLLFIGLVISATIGFEIYRWQTFQDVTNSDIGYWKWKFVIESNNR